MKRIAWHRLLALGVMVASMAGRAQAQEPQTPKATVRELATIDGYVGGFVRLPDGRTLIYDVDDSTFAYDVATKRRTLLGLDMRPAMVSPRGDRLAFGRRAEGGRGLRLWTIPIDPRTGSSTGQAQLVSQRRIDNALRPRFSPDGRTLAFFSPSGTPATAWDVVVVPSTGGAESAIANYPVARAFAWSADGTSLDVEVYAGGTAIERVPVAGAAKRSLFPITPATSTMGVGVSPDARVAIYTMNPDRFFYRTASGGEGEINVPLPKLDDGWGYDFSLDANNRYLSATYLLSNQRVRVLDVGTGRTRDVLPGETSTRPAWSPDGRRLAVLTGNLSHYDIAIVNADGSGLRRYPLQFLLVWMPSGFVRPWSPDGRFLAFFAEVGGRVGYTPGNQRRLVILDVASGSTRVLTTTPGHFGALEWRSDSKAVRLIKNQLVPVGARGLRSLVEVSLDGTEKLLRDVSAEFPRANRVLFASDREVVVTVPVDTKVERYLVPLNGGAARRLPDPGTEPGSREGGNLVVGNWLGIAQVDGRGEVRAARMLSMTGDSTRTVRFPFAGNSGVASVDGNYFTDSNRSAGDSVFTVYRVPLDGSATRIIGQVRDVTMGVFAPSPDGTLFAYTSEGRYTSKLHEIDFAPVIQAVVRR